MAHSKGPPLASTPNTLVEQRAHNITNKAQQTGRQIHFRCEQRRQSSGSQPVDGTLHSCVPQREPEGHTSTARKQHSPETPLIHHPYLKRNPHLWCDAEVHIQTATHCRGHGIHGVHLAEKRQSAWASPGIRTEPGTHSSFGDAYPDMAGQNLGKHCFGWRPTPKNRKLRLRKCEDAPHPHRMPVPRRHHRPQNVGHYQMGLTP